jgi:regulator of sigma E protease
LHDVAWVIAIAGIVLLVVLHEAGHFAAAKAAGMRVERFSLFFPPTILSFTRGETEYAIGAIPAGGYVKITGMSPEEMAELAPELQARSYYAQKPWKRILVILAGPGVNLAIAFVLFTVVLMAGTLGGATTISNIAPEVDTFVSGTTVAALVHSEPAYGRLQIRDRIVRIDGRRATTNDIIATIRRDRCAGALTQGCRAARPVLFLVDRHGVRRAISLYPRYEKAYGHMMVGFDLAGSARQFSLPSAIVGSGETMWSLTSGTLTGLFHALTSSKARRQLHSIVGITQVTEEAVALGPTYGLVIIGVVSLILGVINLFPFLPLDGGHVLWSVAEKLHGGRISTQAMWKFSSVGIVLLVFLVFSGISNDISRLSGN